MKSYLIVLCISVLIFTAKQARGQVHADTILVYDLNTQAIDTILPVSVDPAIQFDKTSSFTGALGNQVPLSLTPPTNNLFSNSQFSALARAELFFDLADYPVRTAIALRGIVNGDSTHRCSGMMVAPDFVLTAGHCVYDYFNSSGFYADSFYVAPAFNNGSPQVGLPVSQVDKVYIFKRFYDKTGYYDIALAHLMQPIGQQIGWTGIAFSSDTSYFTGKVFHKFSYPATTMYPDTAKHYNGDTLYYNYGDINNLPSGSDLGILSPNAQAIPGQSGSTFMFTDNSEYYSFGVATFSYYYRHFQITNDIFYQFKNVIENYITGTPGPLTEEHAADIYPNPVVTKASIRLNKAVDEADMMVFNLYGQQVKHIKNISGQTLAFYRDNLPGGIYFIQVVQDNKVVTSNKLIITDN